MAFWFCLLWPLLAAAILAVFPEEKALPRLNIMFSGVDIIGTLWAAFATDQAFSTFWVDDGPVRLMRLFPTFAAFTGAVFLLVTMVYAGGRGCLPGLRGRATLVLMQLVCGLSKIAISSAVMMTGVAVSSVGIMAICLSVFMLQGQEALRSGWDLFRHLALGLLLTLLGSIFLEDATVAQFLPVQMHQMAIILMIVGLGICAGLLPCAPALVKAQAYIPPGVGSIVPVALFLPSFLFLARLHSFYAHDVAVIFLMDRTLMLVGAASMVFAVMAMKQAEELERISYFLRFLAGLMLVALSLDTTEALYAALLVLAPALCIGPLLVFAVRMRREAGPGAPVGYAEFLTRLALIGLPPFGVGQGGFLLLGWMGRILPLAGLGFLCLWGVAGYRVLSVRRVDIHGWGPRPVVILCSVILGLLLLLPFVFSTPFEVIARTLSADGQGVVTWRK